MPQRVEVVISASSSSADPGAQVWQFPSLTSRTTLRGCHPPPNGLAVARRPRGLGASDPSAVSAHVLATTAAKSGLCAWTLRREQPTSRSYPPERCSVVAVSACGSLVASFGACAYAAGAGEKSGASKTAGAGPKAPSAASSGSAHIWDAHTGSLLGSFDAHPRPVTCASFARGAALLVTGSEDGTLRVWSVAEACVPGVAPAPECVIPAHAMGVAGLAVHLPAAPAGRSRAVSVSRDGGCRGWDLDTGACLFDVRTAGPLTCVCLDAAFTLAFAGTREGDILRIDLGAAAGHGAAAPGGGGAGGAGGGGAGGGGASTVLAGHDGAVLSASLSRDGTTLVTGGDDATVRVWDVASGQHLRTLKGHTGPVTCVATVSIDAGDLERPEAGEERDLWAPPVLEKFARSG